MAESLTDRRERKSQSAGAVAAVLRPMPLLRTMVENGKSAEVPAGRPNRTSSPFQHFVGGYDELTLSALLQLNPAVRCRYLQFSSPSAHRPGERLRAETPLYGNRKVRVNPAIGRGRIHLEFR